MGIEIHAPRAQAAMRLAGRAAAATLAFVGARLAPGISTAQIDRWVREHTKSLGGKPSQLGYHGFPAAVCTSRNNVVCHGIPKETDILELGDIVNVDVTTELGGYHGDTSATFMIGEVSPDVARLVDIARRCRDAGIAVIRDNARLGDIGAAIEELARSEGMSVVREVGGHGIGRTMHAPPHVNHYGTKGAGMRLKAGMAITVEPMINLGTARIRTLSDGWTMVTDDGKPSAQFEHTVIVTRTGYEITTLPSDERPLEVAPQVVDMLETDR
ncbi:MAG: type I methionyl aminopeptidase [Polyangiaceae bacterium]|nr:type I methionyl aminopeptidase [Polyangiaceae bacterium]